MIPVTTIGGYLGAGKTTLINHLLRNPDGQKLAILVNEFGALSIDEDLIEAQDDDLISIAGGCICCSFGDNLVGALMDLMQRQPRPDHIVIEASGVAIPGAIAASLSLVQGLKPNGVVVLADSETVRDLSNDTYLGDTILRQLKDADLVIATKTDLVAESWSHDLGNWLATVSPRAALVHAIHGHVSSDIILGPRFPEMPPEQSRHSDSLFKSKVFPISRPLDLKALVTGLTSPELGITRAKGFVLTPTGETVLVQVIGRRAETSTSPNRSQHAVVCIGPAHTINTQELDRLFNSVSLCPTRGSVYLKMEACKFS
ncbi:CobW family GTP-binding protein [Falsiruegeria litorea]|uniref:CobW family GTP-binding protein n=1 Tax=Falsiruegeria litorea TaxID=1280831 RepID=UPI001BFD340F|nr:GTP-binding protein [Falsiruegeria litorea]